MFTLTSREKDEADAEYHEHYIDVQYWISGCELMGIKERERRPYKLKMESNDLFLLDEELCGEKFVKAEKGDYMILFPCDIHRPGVLCGKSQTYRKAVIKVSIETL